MSFYTEFFSATFGIAMGVFIGAVLALLAVYLYKFLAAVADMFGDIRTAFRRWAHRDYTTEIRIDQMNRDLVLAVRGLKGLEDLVKAGAKVDVRKATRS